nr:HIT family protein [Pseudopedobacter sp.]
MSTLFSKIVSGDIPAHKVAETSDFLAFLDINPLKMGHVLVIPKKEVDYIFDVDDELYTGLMIFTKIVAKAIKKAIPCTRIGVAVIGLEVPHAHVHLIPIDRMSDMDFGNNKLEPTQQELSEVALRILDALKDES